jgi:1-deoxy-D-xylulose-5-phosphate reductoisomerase
VQASGATLLPIDSEHNAIFQCLPNSGDSGNNTNQGVRRLLLTGSGGPFLDYPLDQLHSVTPDQACRHPNWTMGRKISVDSATMMNKGLELIEACHLFGVGPDQVEVVIHPQSVVHSMVDYVDGSVLAQLGNPDMRTPIAHALAWPERMDSGVAPLDIIRQGQLDFRAPDLQRFPCLALAIEAAKAGCGAQIALNAANEVAVEAFLAESIGFLDIADLIDQVVNGRTWAEPKSLEQVHELDQIARVQARELCTSIAANRSH